MNEYFNTIRRRLDGIPSNSESESESMIFDSISVEENFSDSLLLQTSKKTVHLIDPGLFSSTDDKSMHVLAVYIPSFQILPGNFSRLSLLNFIPEFSLCIIGNQFGSEIFFLRLCKCKNNASVIEWDYSFVMEMNVVLDGRILGLYIPEIENNYSVLIYALTENLSFYIFRLTKCDIEKLFVVNI